MKKARTLLAIGLLAAGQAAVSADAARAARYLTAEQAGACIKHALAAKPGHVLELEAKVDNNRTMCEVEIVGTDGKKYEVIVDVAGDKVAKVKG